VRGRDVREQRLEETPESQSATSWLPADSTGVANLDAVMGGGITRRALVIVVGPPGSGKTTLANQMAFAAAQQGRKALVLTALSEPSAKLVQHLRGFEFFDDDLVGDMVQVISIQPFLPRGLEATADEVLAIARRAHASFIVLDGFRGIRGAEPNPQAAREFLYDLGSKLSLLGATTVITSESDPHDPSFFPEATVADVIIGLHFTLAGVRQQRAIEVVKVRGGQPMPGLHGLELTSNGAVVYPRLEARVLEQARASALTLSQAGVHVQRDEVQGRAPFGLPELDALLGGGLPRETSTLVVGSLGTGKTLLALHFALACVESGEPTVFVSLREGLEQLLRKADAFALGPTLRRALHTDGGLTFLRYPAVELNPDIVADRIMAELDRARARRVIIDGVAELEHAIVRSGDPRRVSDYLTAMMEAFQTRGLTSLFITEHPKVVAAQLDFSADPVSVLAENVLLLQQVYFRSRLHRVLSIVKMRLSAHDFMLREFVIQAPEGIRVLEPIESGPEVLAGIARQQSAPLPRTRQAGDAEADASGATFDARGHHSRGKTPEGTQ
jgi:circadian clock protein KaiC